MIILDTSFFAAFKNQRDEHHASAARHWDAVLAEAPVLIHEYAFVEMMAVLTKRAGLAIAVEAGRELLAASEVEWVAGSPRFERAWLRFAGQRGTRHSLADAALLALGEERGPGAMATFDGAFRKAKGLRVVPSRA